MLDILICTLPERKESFEKLRHELTRQEEKVWSNFIKIYYSDDVNMTIGEKRNYLLQQATSEYLCFIDDDDMVASDYLYQIAKALQALPDCCSLRGVITWNGINPEIFEHSIKYSAYKTNEITAPVKYERYPNHLNVIKRNIAQQFRFPEIMHGEDTDWATQIFKSGLLKREEEIKQLHIMQDNAKKDAELKQIDINLKKVGIQPGDKLYMRFLTQFLTGMYNSYQIDKNLRGTDMPQMPGESPYKNLERGTY